MAGFIRFYTLRSVYLSLGVLHTVTCEWIKNVLCGFRLRMESWLRPGDYTFLKQSRLCKLWVQSKADVSLYKALSSLMMEIEGTILRNKSEEISTSATSLLTILLIGLLQFSKLLHGSTIQNHWCFNNSPDHGQNSWIIQHRTFTLTSAWVTLSFLD